MALAGGACEIDAVARVLFARRCVQLKCDPKRTCCIEPTIGIEGVTQPLRLPAFTELLGAIGADRNDGKTELRELSLDLAQLPELRVAVGSPPATVEDEECTGLLAQAREIERVAVDVAHGD